MRAGRNTIEVQTLPDQPEPIKVQLAILVGNRVIARNALEYQNMGAALADLANAAEKFATRMASSILGSLTADAYPESESGD